MHKHALVLTTCACLLGCGSMTAGAQEVPRTPTAPQLPQQLERQLQREQILRRGGEDDSDQEGGRMMDWRPRRDWDRGAMGPGMMGRGGLMGPGNMGPASMGSGVMMRMLFGLMDADGNGTVSLQEFQSAHERIFKAMDVNKDGQLTLEEIQGFMQGPRRSVPRQ